MIQVEKPLGVALKASKKGVSGGVEVASAKGNAAKAGLKAGDYIVYCSSFFGDELWPADQLGFVRSAIQACPNQVDFIVVRDPKIADTIDVKRLPKRPSPPASARGSRRAEGARHAHLRRLRLRLHAPHALHRTGPRVRVPAVQRAALAIRQVRRRDGQGHRREQGAPHHHGLHRHRARGHRILPHAAAVSSMRRRGYAYRRGDGRFSIFDGQDDAYRTPRV